MVFPPEKKMGGFIPSHRIILKSTKYDNLDLDSHFVG